MQHMIAHDAQHLPLTLQTKYTVMFLFCCILFCAAPSHAVPCHAVHQLTGTARQDTELWRSASDSTGPGRCPGIYPRSDATYTSITVERACNTIMQAACACKCFAQHASHPVAEQSLDSTHLFSSLERPNTQCDVPKFQVYAVIAGHFVLST